MRLEHVNITVADPKASAAVLQDIFGWHIRWEGAAMGDGYAVHVGDDESYLALYSPGKALADGPVSYGITGGMNHIGVTVDNLTAVEAKVKAAGFATHSHADYEPGTRFYFDGPDGVEYEVVSYD